MSLKDEIRNTVALGKGLLFLESFFRDVCDNVDTALRLSAATQPTRAEGSFHNCAFLGTEGSRTVRVFLDPDCLDDGMQSNLRMLLESGPGTGNSSGVRCHRVTRFDHLEYRSLCATIMCVKRMILTSSTYGNSTVSSDPV